MDYGPSKNALCDHSIKCELVSLAEPWYCVELESEFYADQYF